MDRIQVHTVPQPDSDITAFVLSCNRLNLLDKTMASFMETRDLPTKMVIVDDSGKEGIFETLVSKYGNYCDVICFPLNRGLYWAKDFMTSFCYTDYIFYIEEDWEFLKGGYLSKSKQVLEKYREIGSVDLSWRTFEEEGFHTYDPQLVDDLFYYKKPWRISDNHVPWFIWQGSPNLKRREDLVFLGRTEIKEREWSIDKKFYALGYKGVYLNDRYVIHLGDHQSVMVNNRKDEHLVGDLVLPPEVKQNKTYPSFDPYSVGEEAIKQGIQSKKGFGHAYVTCLLDLERENVDGRNFADHYLKGFEKLATTSSPLVVFTSQDLVSWVYKIRGSKPTHVIPFSLEQLRNYKGYNRIREIVSSSSWLNQSSWISDSILSNPDYIALTHHKIEFLKWCVNDNYFNTTGYFWVDSGMHSSYNVSPLLDDFNIKNLYDFNILMPTYPYSLEENSEIHGYSKEGYLKLGKKYPSKVCRATLFGGHMHTITKMYDLYHKCLEDSLEGGYIGTEESILTLLCLYDPSFMKTFDMPSGDINYLINHLTND